jgi:hypothetical protein
MKQELEKYIITIKMMYKRKDKKIQPVNVSLPNGVNSGGESIWRYLNSSILAINQSLLLRAG